MVKVTSSDLPEDDQELLAYISDDSDDDEDSLMRKFKEIEPLVTLDSSFPNVIVIAGCPVVAEERREKLIAVLQSLISKELRKRGGELGDKELEIELPMKDGSTKGYGFVTFASAFEAQHAAKHLNGFTLDKKSTLDACLLDDFDEIISRDENYRPPIKLLGFTRENFRWWLSDKRCREQIVVRYEDETEIYWHDPVEMEPQLVYNGRRERAEGKRVWTDFRVQWSPQGSYLATFHRPGIALWACPNFDKKVRFEHKDVKQIDFSPNEEYIITWDGSPAALQNEKAVRVWQVMTGQLLRAFATPSKTPRGNEFPHFVWSPKDKFVARMGEGELYIYELPAMTLVEDAQGKKAPLAYPLEKFDWSPGDCILSIWIPASQDAPGRLLLVEVPSRKELATKNVYNVREASMHWQSAGDYLCLRTVVWKKTGKKGRKPITQLEIFRMREKNIPVDNIQIEDMTVRQLHWEEGPSKRFALIVQDEATNSQAVDFYAIQEDTVLLSRFDISSNMNFMTWAPGGTNFMLAALGVDCVLYFCKITEQGKVEVLHKDEHFMCNEVKWSACGRYVASMVCMPMVSVGHQVALRLHKHAGYNIWTFQGKLQYSCLKDPFYQFHWRPHPPSLTPPDKIEDIRKNLKEYTKRYDGEDEKLRIAQLEAFLSERRAAMAEFDRVYQELIEWKESQKEHDQWQQAQADYEAMFEWENKEEVIEEELDVKEEVIDGGRD